jgi:N6-adenosine-specific RNA methylase IME4/ParB-like chromosome segregation protein Spo0J
MNLEAHAAAGLFPMLDDGELDELAADIAKNGLIEPVVVFEQKILDGRNRVEACRRAKIEPSTRVLSDCDSPTAYVISANLHRRHLSHALRSASAVDALPLFRAEAEARQKAGKSRDGDAGGRGRRKPWLQTATEVLTPALPRAASRGRASDEAAHAFHAGERAVACLAAVKRDAPEVFAAVKARAIPSVADAVRISKLEPQARASVLQALESGSDVRQALAQQARAERVERVTEISTGNSPITGELGRFPVIYADPPWRYEHVKTESRAIENQYPTMELDAICALPVAEIATEDAVLFLWATSPKLAEAMRVIEAWGFSYRTCMAWVKDQIGMGYYARQRHELFLIAARGALPVPLPANRPDSVIEAPLAEHSAKPAIFAKLIERMYPEHKRIELFCRSPRAGWSAWGNQSGGAS